MKKFLMTVVFLFMAIGLSHAEEAKAILAGGCFWCVESDLENVLGVKSVVSGYSGGSGDDPTYHTYTEMGYVEVVEVAYDPSVISYSQLLDVFLQKIDPTDSEGQFCDRGSAYRPVIFYSNEEEKKLAEDSKVSLSNLKKLTKPVTIEIIAASKFYPAEEYHQDYYKKNPVKYKFYRFKCGRDQFLERIWGKSKGH